MGICKHYNENFFIYFMQRSNSYDMLSFMRFTDDFKKAIKGAILKKDLTNAEFSKLSGLPLETARRYKNGEGKSISDANAVLACRALGLNPHDYLMFTPPPSPVSAVHPSEFTEVPVLGFASAIGWEPAVEPWDDFLKGCADDYHSFVDVKKGYFALRVEGQSMSPSFPDGTLLLVAGGEFPKRGDLVVAKLSDLGGIVVVKRYQCKDSVVSLESEHKDGQNFEINKKEEHGRIIWMYPVRKAEIDLRARRNGK